MGGDSWEKNFKKLEATLVIVSSGKYRGGDLGAPEVFTRGHRVPRGRRTIYCAIQARFFSGYFLDVSNGFYTVIQTFSIERFGINLPPPEKKNRMIQGDL